MLRKWMAAAFAALMALPGAAQGNDWNSRYKVKKKDTVYGIAKAHGVTQEQLMDANPEMRQEGYELIQGDIIFIPAKGAAKPAKAVQAKPAAQGKLSGKVRVGVMLPLHSADGDGARMVEYYRGMLMACDSLKSLGLSVDVRAWNVPIEADVRQTLRENGADGCDLIFGPLYTSQVKPLAAFCREKGIRMVIPFSITGDEVYRNPAVFQVYQAEDRLNNEAIAAYVERFPGCHTVVVDCNDSTGRKATFTTALRNALKNKGMDVRITNLNSSETDFAKAFSKAKRNVVVLNSALSPKLLAALAKLNTLAAANPKVEISLFGHTEWLMFAKYQTANFHKYDCHIPAPYYYNPAAKATTELEEAYRRNFGADMMKAIPRFALTGFDHAMFFIGGAARLKDKFEGAPGQSAYKPVQTPLRFKRASGGGGLLNTAFQLVHYRRDLGMELISY